MTKKKIIGIIVGGAIGMYVAAAAAFIFLVENNKNSFSDSVTLNVDEVETQTLSFEALSLKPGDSKDFYINLKSDSKATFAVSLDFVQIEDHGLTEFINVAISYNNYSYTDSLINLFSSEEPLVSFNCDFKEEPVEKINVRYYMPAEIGNEAQGKQVDFNLVVNIQR